MNTKDLQNQLLRTAERLMRYKMPVFLGVVGLVYVFVIWRVDTLKHAQPTAAAITAATKTDSTASPHINQATINKINQLQDNSVSVQALFDQARNNPFSE